jgi:hypothetical protein
MRKLVSSLDAWGFRFLSLGAVILAWTLGLIELGRKALWIDEADSVYFASRSVRTLFTTLCDPHPPGYYLLLKGWSVLGWSEFWVRMPTVLMATLAVPLVVRLGRELAGAEAYGRHKGLGALSGWLLAASPLHLWYAREARMYAGVTTLGILMVVLAWGFAHTSRRMAAVGYGIVAILALFIDQSAIFPLVMANLLWGAYGFHHWSWRHALTWGVLQVMILAGFLAWRVWSAYPAGGGSETLYQVTMLMQVLQRAGMDVSRAQVLRLLWICLGGGALGGTLLYGMAVVRRWPPSLGTPVWRGVGVLFALATVGMAVPRLFTVKRFLVTVWPYVVLLAAYGLLRVRLPLWFLIIGLLVSSALTLSMVLSLSKGRWPAVVAQMAPAVAPDDKIWVDEVAVPAFDYYYNGKSPRFILRASELLRFEAAWQESGDNQRIWLVVMADDYRNLLDYFAPEITEARVWASDWPGIKVRAYEPVRLGGGVSPLVDRSPPTWLVNWPSPVDAACVQE